MGETHPVCQWSDFQTPFEFWTILSSFWTQLVLKINKKIWQNGLVCRCHLNKTGLLPVSRPVEHTSWVFKTLRERAWKIVQNDKLPGLRKLTSQLVGTFSISILKTDHSKSENIQYPGFWRSAFKIENEDEMKKVNSFKLGQHFQNIFVVFCRIRF